MHLVRHLDGAKHGGWVGAGVCLFSTDSNASMTGVNVDVVVDDEETFAKTNNSALHTYSKSIKFRAIKKSKN